MFDVFQSLSRSSDRCNLKDGELIGMAQGGDQVAFGELVRRYHQQVFNALSALVGDLDDADDLAQEVFVKAHRALPGFEGRSKFYTWLYRLAINCWKDWLKMPKQQKELREAFDVYDADYTAVPAPDASVENRELLYLLERALRDLPVEYRATVILREMEGLDYEDIARVLNCSVGTVKSRLFRARLRLKQMWETEYRAQWEGVM